MAEKVDRGVLLGAGSFQLYDGTIQHKLMRLHQIRYNVDILPYDLIWNIAATVMILIGISLIIRTRRSLLKMKAEGRYAQ